MSVHALLPLKNPKCGVGSIQILAAMKNRTVIQDDQLNETPILVILEKKNENEKHCRGVDHLKYTNI